MPETEYSENPLSVSAIIISVFPSAAAQTYLPSIPVTETGDTLSSVRSDIVVSVIS